MHGIISIKQVDSVERKPRHTIDQCIQGTGLGITKAPTQHGMEEW